MTALKLDVDGRKIATEGGGAMGRSTILAVLAAAGLMLSAGCGDDDLRTGVGSPGAGGLGGSDGGPADDDSCLVVGGHALCYCDVAPSGGLTACGLCYICVECPPDDRESGGCWVGEDFVRCLSSCPEDERNPAAVDDGRCYFHAECRYPYEICSEDDVCVPAPDGGVP